MEVAVQPGASRKEGDAGNSGEEGDGGGKRAVGRRGSWRRRRWRRRWRRWIEDGGIFLNLRLGLDLCGLASHGDRRGVQLRRDAVWIRAHWLNVQAKLVTWGGARGDGRGGAGVCLEAGETSGGLNLAGECLGAHSVGSPIDLEVDLDVGGEEATTATP